MNQYPLDIEQWITTHFDDTARVYAILSQIKSDPRLMRSVLSLSGGDYSWLIAWSNAAIVNIPLVIKQAETNQYDFNKSIKQKPYWVKRLALLKKVLVRTPIVLAALLFILLMMTSMGGDSIECCFGGCDQNISEILW